MMGWLVIVSTCSPEESDPRDKILATWEVGPGGIGWIKKLVASGKAAHRSFDGYPNRYIARAADILPLLASGPPAHTGPAVLGDDYVLPANWQGPITLHTDRIGACSAEHMLTIDAWDRS